MRILAFVMIGLVVLCALVIGYSMWAAALGVETLQVSVLPASQAGAQFEALKLDGQMEAVQGVVYQDVTELGDASGYEFHVYDATVRNRGFLGAEWVELTAAQSEGDILQETQELPPDIAGFGKGTLRTVVLARAGSTPSTTVALTYFVFGRPYSLPLTAEWVAQTAEGADAAVDQADYVPAETPAPPVQTETPGDDGTQQQEQPQVPEAVNLAPIEGDSTPAPGAYMPS